MGAASGASIAAVDARLGIMHQHPEIVFEADELVDMGGHAGAPLVVASRPTTLPRPGAT